MLVTTASLTREDTGMQLERLSPHLGARVSGVDLAQLGASDREAVLAPLEEHLVLVFEGQKLDPQGFQRFAEVVGEVEPVERAAPFTPTLDGDLARINYLEIDPSHPRGTYSDRWHTDLSFFEAPTFAALLMPAVLPRLGGDTLWSSMVAAYEQLPDSLRRAIEDLEAIHSVNLPDGRYLRTPHPVVRVNPRDGRRGLYVNESFTTEVVGLSPMEGAQLLDLLCRHLTLPDFQMRLRWSEDLVVLWDNRFTQHYAVRDYGERRRMLRMSVAGERPIGPRDYALRMAS